MRPLEAAELADLGSYAELRADYRRAVIAHKKSRRMAVGDCVTLLFEDRETLRFQVQEMLWVERIAEPERVQHELDVYNELMPGERELSATLFIEITEPGRIRSELDRLIGLDEHVELVVGAGADAAAVEASFDAKQIEEDRISAVQYIRFALDAAQLKRFADPSAPAAVRIEHPAYRHEQPIPPAVRESLVAGLRREPASLLPPMPRAERAEPELVLETEHARVVRPAPPRLPGELRVEARAAWPERGAIDAERWAALLDALRGAVDSVIAQHGGCQVFAELAPGATPVWRVLPRR